MSDINVPDSPFASAGLYDTGAFIAALEDYQFAAATSAQLIQGNIYNLNGQTIGTYSYTLPFTGLLNSNYLANQTTLTSILTSHATYMAGYTYGQTPGPVGIDIQTSALGNVLFNTGARTVVNITTVSPLLNSIIGLGRVN